MRAGQAMVESMLVLLLMTVVFFGLFQFFYAAAAQDVLDHAAARAARARTVGFNRWMTVKAARVAAIPVSGKMITPETPENPGLAAVQATRRPGTAWARALRANPRSAQAQLENALIPDYMASPHSNQSRQTLDYEAWEGNGAHPLDIQWDEDSVGDWDNWDGDSIGNPSGSITYIVGRAFNMLVSWGDIARGLPTGENPGVLNLKGRYKIERHYDYYLENFYRDGDL